MRFRRQRGNTCLPGEPKPNMKRVKEEPGALPQVKKAPGFCSSQTIQAKPEPDKQNRIKLQTDTVQDKSRNPSQAAIPKSPPSSEPTSTVPTPVPTAKTNNQIKQQTWVRY